LPPPAPPAACAKASEINIVSTPQDALAGANAPIQ
jgi:hypothetical protein